MTPVGITSVIAGKILAVNDLALVMSQLAWFIVTIVIGVFFYQLVIMQLIYLAFVRKNPFKFYAGLAQGTLTAFAMASTWVADLRFPSCLRNHHALTSQGLISAFYLLIKTSPVSFFSLIFSSFARLFFLALLLTWLSSTVLWSVSKFSLLDLIFPRLWFFLNSLYTLVIFCLILSECTLKCAQEMIDERMFQPAKRRLCEAVAVLESIPVVGSVFHSVYDNILNYHICDF